MMNLEEIDEALAKLPTTPVTDADIEARADLAWRRGELISAALTEAARPKVVPGPLEINVPQGAASCLYTQQGLTRRSERVGDREIMRLTSGEFRTLLGGKHGHLWSALNPEIVRQIAAGDMAVSQAGMR